MSTHTCPPYKNASKRPYPLGNGIHTHLMVRWVSVVYLLAATLLSSANIPNHYIIAFDQSIGKYRPDYLSKSILTTLDKVLADNGFDTDSDYVSMVAYTMEMGNPSIDRFVRPYTSGGSPVVWRRLGDQSLSSLFPNWPSGQPLLNQASAPYGSMQSLAKPYIVMETKARPDSQVIAGHTYMLMVTDEVVNGVDDNYKHEWNNVATSSGADTHRFNTIAPGVFETMGNFNEEFNFAQVKLKRGKSEVSRILVSDDGAYKIIPYEVVSVERPSIHAISDIPSPLPIRRVRGGFRLSLDASTLTPKYDIASLTLSDSRGRVIGASPSGRLDIDIPSSELAVGDTVSLSMSLNLYDGLYDGILITPSNPRYHDGMTVRQVVKLQDEAKVLGLMPLHDMFWWWCPDDILSAVMIWDAILILIGAVIVGCLFYWWFVRVNAYRPSNDKLKITKV